MIYFLQAAHFLIGALVLICAWLIKYRKVTWLIAGYNTASKKSKESYDIEKLTRYVGNFLFILAAIFLLMAFAGILLSDYIEIISRVGYGVLAISSVWGLIYLNTKNKVKK